MNADPNLQKPSGLDWEKTLREGRFELPEASWQRMENDMRAFLAARSREAAHPKAPTWRERLVGWLATPSLRWGAGLASLIVIGLLVVGGRAGFLKSDALAWVPGQTIGAPGSAHWNWKRGRCTIDGANAKLVLREAKESGIQIDLLEGEATFHVEHRRLDESFSVKLGDCQVHVVGTVFTVGVDSLKQWVSVEEGKIRFENDRGQRMVGKGQSSVCGEWGNAGVPLVQESVAATVPVAVPVADPAKSATPPAKTEIVVPSCLAGDACIAELSNFVRSHPEHPAVAQIALRWARLASAKGDHRDALVAYGVAMEKDPNPSSLTRLEWYRTKVMGLGQTAGVSDSLDRWIEGLPKAGAVWRDAVGLRREVARRSGDETTVKRLDAQLQSPPRAETGGP
jgi:hypothetical protein